jgi:hypothetical protein
MYVLRHYSAFFVLPCCSAGEIPGQVVQVQCQQGPSAWTVSKLLRRGSWQGLLLLFTAHAHSVSGQQHRAGTGLPVFAKYLFDCCAHGCPDSFSGGCGEVLKSVGGLACIRAGRQHSKGRARDSHTPCRSVLPCKLRPCLLPFSTLSEQQPCPPVCVQHVLQQGSANAFGLVTRVHSTLKDLGQEQDTNTHPWLLLMADHVWDSTTGDCQQVSADTSTTLC